MTDPLDLLYRKPLGASRQGPLYNAFSYPTKISAESVAVFIACHTKPGDRVLDTFGGSGTTGIAALLCERPTAKMLQLAADIGVDPEWGARDAVVYELSEIGSLVARVMTHAPDPEAFAAAAERLLARAEQEQPALYQSVGPDGAVGALRHIIWADQVRCPRCATTTTYAEVRVRFAPLRFDDAHVCERCSYRGAPDDWVRVLKTRTDPWTGQEVTERVRVPWRIYGTSPSGNWVRDAVPEDAATEQALRQEGMPAGAPLQELRWGDLYRGGYHQGMTHLHHLYTARNFTAIATLLRLLDDEPVELREALRLLVLSYNATHSTLMTRVVLKRNSTEFVLTGAQSGVLYVSGLPVEKNVFRGLRRKIGVFRQAFALLHGMTGTADVITGSSTTLALPTASIDYAFTDPPFGAYIPYAEINQINELWMGRRTDTKFEAIVSPSQKKGISEYTHLLTEVFTETARVLKPGAEETIVFHSAHADVWQALATSLQEAGLTVLAASILDKTQSSFKQVSGHVAVSGDPLLRVRRTAAQETVTQAPTIDELADDVVASLVSGTGRSDDRREAAHSYSRVIGKALVAGATITLDAHRFYARRKGSN